jgi:hypothetical protein
MSNPNAEHEYADPIVRALGVGTAHPSAEAWPAPRRVAARSGAVTPPGETKAGILSPPPVTC